MYSLLDGFSSPKENAKRAKELGIKNLGTSDHGNCFSWLQHKEACKKNDIKAILGTELYVTDEPAILKSNRYNSHMVVFSLNKEGKSDLWNLSSLSWSADYFYYKPRIQLYNFHTDNKIDYGIEEFSKNGNLFAINGHQGSKLSNILFQNPKDQLEKQIKDLRKAYNQYKISDLSFYEKFLQPNWLEDACKLAIDLNKLFVGNFAIELQDELNPEDKLALWIHPLIKDCLRKVSKETGIRACASSDPHYARKEYAESQRIMVMTQMKETEETVKKKLEDENNQDVFVFFGSDNFYIKSYDEMLQKFTKEELEETNKIADLVKDYDITEKPELPVFQIPEFKKDYKWLNWIEKDVDKYIFTLCVEGLAKIKPWNNSGIPKEKYWERLNEESKVIFEAGLSDYFLVIRDICLYADNRPANGSFDWELNLKNKGKINPIARGDGRGSAAGCLISYALGITGKNCEPISRGLSFARFYNAGRNTKDNISLPDVDLDFEINGRDNIIEYIRNKYGNENVCQIITFGRIQGKAGIKDIFRIKGIENYFELANDLCQYIPDEAKIADELQERRDLGEEYSILDWCLENVPYIQQKYENDKTIKMIIDQAREIEGTYRNAGKHASGVVVSKRKAKDCFPMALDTKSKEPIAAVDMRDIEKLGAVKFDILGVCILDRLKYASELINANNN